MMTHPRCDGASDDLVVRGLSVLEVFKLGFGGEDVLEEPIEELAVTATVNMLARVGGMS